MNTKKTWFVTGGAGFYGINMVRRILEAGDKVVVYDLLPFDYPERESKKDSVKEVIGDIRNFDFLKESMKGCDIVVHAAAALPLYSQEDIFTTDIDGSRNVVKAAHELGIKRVVHISSTAVYGIPDHHPLVETDRLVGVGPYGFAKIEAEKIGRRRQRVEVGKVTENGHFGFTPSLIDKTNVKNGIVTIAVTCAMGGCDELPQGRVSASVDAVLDKLLKTISPAMPDEADSGNF
jgi:UDP-glucose 4-epimerase